MRLKEGTGSRGDGETHREDTGMASRAVTVWCMAADAGVFVTGLSLHALRGSV